MTTETAPTLWIEVDDLIRYFDGSVTPTGVSRVQLRILECLLRDHAHRIAFCRLGKTGAKVEIVAHADLARLTDGNGFLSRYGSHGRLLPLLKAARWSSRRLADAMRRPDGGVAFAARVRPNDVLVSLGASWTHANFARSVARLKREHGLRFAMLLHDILPLSHPNYCNPSQIPAFAAWFDSVAPVWDLVMTPSQSTATTLRRHIATRGLEPPELAVIRLGDGLPCASSPLDVPIGLRSHVLYVSTIEIRKNHGLLVEVWQRLIRTHGAEATPELVFAGKFGWEIDDLRRSLNAGKHLDGKIRVVENLSDQALSALYDAALFTVFPSFCEGWGLPVAESLSRGRHCIASDATSIPEVGGRFAEYHDPRDADAAYRLIEAAIFDRSRLARREKLIAEEYRPASWDETSAAIMTAVDGMAAKATVPATPGG